MDKLQFAELVAWVQHRCQAELEPSDLDRLDRMVNTRGNGTITGNDVRYMLEAMARGNKIEAIKKHREMTGYGLKESKDAIEAAMLNRP
jgi:ribosomal protein L7/L12